MNKKYALCIGNNYPGTNAELAGCVNDALDWSDLLVSSGYEVRTIIECPKEDAVLALGEMVDKAGWGDRVVFTYSGHGSWVWDRDGDEADRRDECLVMADYARGGLLLDDEIQKVFLGLRTGVGALFLSDSCHSGTVHRAANLGHKDLGRPRFLSPAAFTEFSEQQARLLEVQTSTKEVRQSSSLVSGCEDAQYSYDAWFDGRANGAFTRAALDNYAYGQSLNSWFKRIRAELPSEWYPQSPVLTAANAYRKYTRAI